MSRPAPSRQSVKIPVDLQVQALALMTPKGYKFQSLLLELLTDWVRQQKNVMTSGQDVSPVIAFENSSHLKLVAAFERCAKANPELSKTYLASLQRAIKDFPQEYKNADPNDVKTGPNAKDRREHN